MTEVLIREAVDADGPELIRLAEATLAEHAENDGVESFGPAFAAPASGFAGRGGRLWVMADASGALVGALGVAAHVRPQEFEIEALFLAPSVRGQGFALALLAGADAFAAASSAVRLTAWIDTRFTGAIRFLLRHGFVRLPGTRARHDGSNALTRHYARDVAAAA
ncbi:GNAT family N-acetyltransferase [Methylopila musalis]|uniref:GNAT family N-acetyltransferase n=1 Tax=Methylopila musalis TaxID=1134781 RepID=A0ABW3Z436_9HYPH